MLITIPKQYLEHFQNNIAYLTWWKKPTLLLMNQKEKESFQKIMNNAWVHYEDGCERGISTPVVELVIENGVIDVPIPQETTRRLQGENRAFTKVKAGIALS
jgi:hypothetical protein